VLPRHSPVQGPLAPILHKNLPLTRMNIKEAAPYVLVSIVLISIAVSLSFIGQSSGNPNTRNELQKQIGILTTVNLLACLILGVLLYYYIQINADAFVPLTVIMITFNLFLSIMSTSIAVLVQSS
jgi:hypothetical protein